MKIPNTIQDLFTSTGSLNSAILRQQWFKETELYIKIMQTSAFLTSDCKFLERIFVFANKITQLQKCTICEKPAHFNTSILPIGAYSSTCNSRSCIAHSTLQKRNACMIERYGALVSSKHNSKNTEKVKHFVEKSKLTIKEKYNVNNPSQIIGNAEKKKCTLLKNFGVDHPAKIKKHKLLSLEKSKQFFQSLSNKITVLSLDEPRKVCKMIKFQCLLCNKVESIPSETFKWRCKKLQTPCSACSGINQGSAFQQNIANFLKQHVEIEINNRKILPSGKELDIFIPSLKIAIEANGVFWHSTKDEKEDKEFKNYHLDKTLECEALGIRLIHIFEDTWIKKRELIESRLLTLISPKRIFARKCVIITISSGEERLFLDKNHIQGYVPSSYRFALLYDKKIVAIMTFGASRFKRGEIELLRFCSLAGTQVIGGASKLLKHAITTLQFNKLVSYSDRTWGSGNLYEQLGFCKNSYSAPSYRWIKSMESKSRFETQKHKLPKLLGENFNGELTESTNMFNSGWRRIWDCGTIKWILRIPL